MSGIITPVPVGRQVIPFGDRPFVDARGHPTFDAYQWMQRITAGFGATITNVSDSITQINNNTTDITQIDADLSGINTEIADILNTIGVLEGWIQLLLLWAPGPPAPPGPPPAFTRPNSEPFPPSPPKWPGPGDFIELESGGVPTKISVMPTATLPLAGTELFPLVQTGGNVKATPDDVLIRSGNLTLVAGGDTIVDTTAMTINASPFTGALLTLQAATTYNIATLTPTSNPALLSQSSTGRTDLYAWGADGNTQGPVMDLIYKATTPTNGDQAGHYAFRADDDAAGEDTIGGLYAFTTNVAHATMSSQLRLGWMDNVNATGGNAQPNSFIEIDTSGGMALPGIPISGVTTLTVSTEFTLGDAVSGTPELIIRGPAGNLREFLYQSGSTNRWMLYADSGAESGGNVGSNFAIGAFTDVGGFIGNYWEIDRATGQTQFAGSGSWSANGAVATAVTGVGPTGSHTTVQEWFTVRNASGTVRYIPAF